MSLFSADRRADTIGRLSSDVYDVVVVGGGITGVGVALDAASRGLRTALVERDDFASGTSSKSSKLVHGGLRYLQSGDVGLVYEALAERQRILKLAPHLVSPLDFVLPNFGNRAMGRAIGTALWMYDLTGGFRIGKLHKRIDAATTEAEIPAIQPGLVRDGFYYPDAQTDDARLTMYIARTAVVHHGADVATHIGAVGVEKDVSGRVSGVAVRDRLDGGREFTIDARWIVNAGGVWSDEIRGLDEGRDPGVLRPAKGIHVTLPRSVVGNRRAIILPVPKDRRSIFVVPWGELAWVGTTDTDYDGPLDEPQAEPEDIHYLLDTLNHWMSTPVDESQIIAGWAGLRPLVGDKSGRTADLSRHHRLIPGSPGMVTITGGKLTTYRRMAKDTIDHVVEHGGFDTRRCWTHRLPIDGAPGFSHFDLDTAGIDLDPSEHRSLLRRHGTNAAQIVSLLRSDPSLGTRVVDDLPYLRAEIVHAVRSEQTLTVEDMLERRVRLSLEHRSRGLDVVDDVAALMGSELGWDELRVRDETRRYVARVAGALRAERLTTGPSLEPFAHLLDETAGVAMATGEG